MSSAVRQEAISLVEKLYMDDYFVPDRKIEWLERYKGGGNKYIFCKRVLGFKLLYLQRAINNIFYLT